MLAFDAPNRNRCWADLIVEACIRGGADRFFIAPGSRSTPLTTAVAAHPRAHVTVHIDERGSAFAALGHARATGRPGVWITTSGTALANGMPAVVEAGTDGVPMLLLTADRPPELRDTAANQTIDQVHLFGRYTRWFADLPTPTTDIAPAFVLTTVAQALHRAQAEAGPVHLNCMFREPLAPEPELFDAVSYLSDLRTWADGEDPYTAYTTAPRVPSDDDLTDLATRLSCASSGWVVVGRRPVGAKSGAIVRLAKALGWPVLPDIGSQLRLGSAHQPSVIPYADQLLAARRSGVGSVPEAVVQVGPPPTSKALLQAIDAASPAVYAVLHAGSRRLDPRHRVTHRVQADEDLALEQLAALLEASADSGRTTQQEGTVWRIAAGRVESAMEERLAQDAERLTEPGVARRLSQLVPASHLLLVANSMPIRDLDRFADPRGAAVPVVVNRGASGIDGLVATAFGAHRGSGRPLTMLTGDLALLHDLNSLALARHARQPFVIVLLNNDGGGIFHFLPIAEHAAVFEPYFGTPHGLGTFRDAAAFFGLAYEQPTTSEAFDDAYEAACAHSGSTLIEVVTDRGHNRALHAAITEAVAEALEEGGGPQGA